MSSREVYRNAWMSVREDQVVLQDGTRGLYGVVDIPLSGPSTGLGVPQGSWGQTTTGSQAELAAAELREETGLRTETLRRLGYLRAAYGFCSQGFDVYLAAGLRPGSVEREISEQDMQHRRVGDGDFRRMVLEGLIVDSATVAAYSLLRSHEG